MSEGQISPGSCERGYRGYSYRECANGQLGEVKTDKCVMKVPDRLSYGFNRLSFVIGLETSSERPRYSNIITNFYLDEGSTLPSGLTLDPTTGVISGNAQIEQDDRAYVIYGSNAVGATSTTVYISVRKGRCMAEGNFETTEVGKVAEYDCSLEGAYVGTQKRACVLGTRDGEWQRISGYCMPIFMIVLLVVVVIVIVMAVVFVLMRSRKTKAVGGVKGKRVAKAAPKKNQNKNTAKKVKV